MVHRLGASILVLLAATVSIVPAAARHAERVHDAGAQRCAREEEESAIQVAEIQQELMVAALTCHNVTEFNAFQNGYLNDLRLSDSRLLAMFRRLDGRRGEAEYHAFKTRLANDSSIRSIHDNPGFCAEAKQIFAQAAVDGRPKLVDFAAGVTLYDLTPVQSCAEIEAAAHVPSIVPTPNPLRLAALSDTAQPAPAATATQQTAAAAPASTTAASKPESQKKSDGFFSSIFD